MGAFKWLKDKALGEEIEDYGEISRVNEAATAPALSAKLTQKGARVFLVLRYGWVGHHRVLRVEASGDLSANLRRIADDIDKQTSVHGVAGSI
ncbi:MAG: hypothetical protein DRQ55_11080 [Planctomycetota bacterium]|nr:MAG: hypothetical protein DRQ55_11080 [Planctomycetota bacterium]